MLAPLGSFLGGLVASAQTSLVIPLVAAGLLIGGGQWATGNPQSGKAWIFGALIGGGVMLLALTLASGMSVLPGAVPISKP